MVGTTSRNTALKATLQEARLRHKIGDLLQAEKLYEAILRQYPEQIHVTNDLGRVLQDQGRLEDAAAAFRSVIAHDPTAAIAHRNLGVVLCELGKLEESFAALSQHAEITLQSSADDTHQLKMAHEHEQREYLEKNKVSRRSPFYLEDGSRVLGRAVNKVAPEVLTQWDRNYPQIMVLDNFLTLEALTKLYRYCLGSTIWQQVYSDGYLGAMPEHGLGSPLLAQIIEELHQACPSILGNHKLLQFWGFKYGDRPNGIAVHADFAAVNVNFWITPDEANLDPERGGIVIWDTPAPLDWDFTKYNDNAITASAYLEGSKAKSRVIPYRCNRAVIFNSNLFHETDRIDFKPGYLNRRVNLTLLFGRREGK